MHVFIPVAAPILFTWNQSVYRWRKGEPSLVKGFFPSMHVVLHFRELRKQG